MSGRFGFRSNTEAVLWQRLLVLLGFPFVLLMSTEMIQRQSLADSFQWIVQWPVEFMINYFFVLLICMLIVMVIGFTWVGLMVSSLLVLLFSFVNYYKMLYLGEPIFPTDLLLSKQGSDLLPYIYKGIGSQNIVVVLVVFALLLALWLFAPRVALRWRLRVCTGVLSGVLLGLLVMYPNKAFAYLENMGVSNSVYQQIENYQHNGLLLGFELNMSSAIIQVPDGYSEQAVRSIFEESKQKAATAPKPQKPTVDNPNVIVVMSEAFWDPTLMTNLKFSADPMPNMRALQKQYTSGWMVSPAFGGGTCNVEFEVLTGDSNNYLPYGSIAYQQYIQQPIPSLASIFEANGYKSEAIHSYYKWFWNRDNVYKNLGFERFLSEEQMKDPVYKGPFIDDREITKYIIQQQENADRSVFLYAVTMQNHGPYTTKRYDQNTIKVTGDIPPESIQAVETYAQGIHDADAQLKALVDHYSKVKEPTILMFFGDHLPLLEPVYQQAGYSGDKAHWTVDEMRKMHSTPLLIWNNFGAKREQLEVSPSFLGPYLLQLAGVPSTSYMNFVGQVNQKFSVIQKGLKIDAGGHAAAEADTDELKQTETDYGMLQYDEMFGERYGGTAYTDLHTP